MDALRDRKKSRLRSELIANAIALFRSRGFDSVRVSEIAEASLVSEATFFNYFGSKDTLLSEWVHDRVEEALDDQLASDRPLRRALREAARSLAEWLESEGPLAALALSRCRSTPRAHAPGRVARPGWRERIALAQQSGDLRRDLPVEELCSIFEASLVRACCDGVGADSASDRLVRAVDLVADGARRRHERVRAGAQRGTPPRSPSP